MALRLDQASVVIRGNFNPYIISPDWLAKQKIWATDEVQVGFGFLKDGVQFQSRSVKWAIDHKGLLVASLSEDCGMHAANVIESLPHTPLTAVGCNFTYVAEVSDWVNSPHPFLDDKGKSDIDAGFPVEAVRWACVFRGDAVQIEMAVTQGDDAITVSFNHHRVTKKPDKAIEAAKCFDSDRTVSNQLIGKILGQRI